MPARHSHAPWRKAILIPCWCIQLFFMLAMIALLGLSIGVIVSWQKSYNNNGYDADDLKKATHIVGPIWITLCVFCVILTIVEIILLARRSLKPIVFLIMNVTKSGIWTVILILDIVSAVTVGGRTTSILGVLIDAILYLSFLVPLIYGSVIFHRSRKEKKFYSPVDAPYNVRNGVHNVNANDLSYPSQYKGFITEQPAASVEAPTERPRRLSYNHTRDTRFESYRRERSMSNPNGDRPSVGSPVNRSNIIPEVYIEHHDGEAFEMEGSRRQLK
ncbi:hypothetical protein BGZ60DRAFT_431641 [Tricladium varicosporioides]|nr:hypothetical protein BGZ60DRAFT_431641 [Hymenoscyphus varicosporioides]